MDGRPELPLTIGSPGLLLYLPYIYITCTGGEAMLTIAGHKACQCVMRVEVVG
jgi:hypothetical protein